MQHGCPRVFDYIDFLKSKNTTVMTTFSQKWEQMDKVRSEYYSISYSPYFVYLLQRDLNLKNPNCPSL